MDLSRICMVSLLAVCSLVHPLFFPFSGVFHCRVFVRGDIPVLCYSCYKSYCLLQYVTVKIYNYTICLPTLT